VFSLNFLDCFTGAGSQSGENKNEEHNEERKKNNTNYNKGKLVQKFEPKGYQFQYT